MDQKQKKTQKLIFKRVMQEWRKKKPYIRPSFNQKKVQTCKLDWLSNSDEKEILLCMWDLKLDIFKREFLKHNKFVPLHLRLKVTLDQIHHVFYRKTEISGKKWAKKVHAMQEIVAIFKWYFCLHKGRIKYEKYYDRRHTEDTQNSFWEKRWPNKFILNLTEL